MIRTLATFAATYTLTALGAAVGIGRWLRSNEPDADDVMALADVVTAAIAEEKSAETPIGDAALLAALEQEPEIEKARAYLAAIETGDDLIYALGGDA